MRILITLVIIIFFNSVNAKSINVIRDEIENLLEDISKELSRETELEKDKLTFFIDNQRYINAFVTPNRHFFTTELLLRSKGIDDLAGVLS